jgi:FlaA1/EpsC-like NDP-sugar epimerase
MSQNYSNHRRFSPTFHFLTVPATLALLIGSIINLRQTNESNRYSATLLVLVSLIFISALLHSRIFALRAQDRAIRAEENLRHFALTGKLLDGRLTIGQVVALRFASDAEFPALAQKAAENNLSGNAIKKQIATWREDKHRV